MKMAKYLLFCLALVAIFAVLVAIDGAEARTATWDGGGGDNLASTAANWDLDTAPVIGDDLVYSSGSKSCTIDIAETFGDITITSGYSGTITQSVSFGYVNYVQSGATMTGNVNHLQTCHNNFTLSGGAITTNVLKLHMMGEGVDSRLTVNAAISFKHLWLSGIVQVERNAGSYALITNSLLVDDDAIITIPTSRFLTVYQSSYTTEIINNGIIKGQGLFSLQGVSNIASTPTLGTFQCPVTIQGTSSSSANYVVTLMGDLQIDGLLTINSLHGTFTCTVDLNDFNLTTYSTIVGARGIIQCGEGEIETASLDSSLGAITEETAIWVFSNNALVKMAAGGALYDVEVDGTAMRLGSDVMMNSLAFIGLTTSHPYGWYENGTRVSSVTTDANGTYSLGSGVFAWDNATLKITPVITIDGWERTDALRNVVWEGYDYAADHDADAVVTWTLSSTGAWLTADTDGEISGEAGDDGTYYYTLTATAANGEQASVSGFIIVENSINDGLDVTFSWLAPLIGLAAVGFLAVGLSALSGSWRKK